MNKRTMAVILVLGLLVVAGLSALAIAVPSGGTGKLSEGQIDAAGSVVTIVKVQYYDSGGRPHQVDLSNFGATYTVGAGDDVIIVATGYYSGSNGKGLIEIYDPSTGQNYASKLIPSGQKVTLALPAALFVGMGETYTIGVIVEGPDNIPQKFARFSITA